eukprot:comp22431_c0_seq1/m.33659 comp22431_c0_seq1/g.33659  ORF comp22431_c0_seq1/g.33659 comp22431_c0_seq1/m.33659 type:complete len:847 (-) comp22431_c0_seq1:319-2859(-)
MEGGSGPKDGRAAMRIPLAPQLEFSPATPLQTTPIPGTPNPIFARDSPCALQKVEKDEFSGSMSISETACSGNEKQNEGVQVGVEQKPNLFGVDVVVSEVVTKLEKLLDGSGERKNVFKYNDITFEEELGRGGFAVVSRGRLGGEVVAIKKLYLGAGEVMGELLNEVSVMRRLVHPNIVQFLGATLPPDPLCIITELMEHGTLAKRVADLEVPLEPEAVLQYSLDIARGMQHLHAAGVIHQDLNPNNILLSSNDVCKVGDFGISRLTNNTSKSVTNRGGGTVAYTAPEVYRCERITSMVDVYSFAICMWQMTSRKQPYAGMVQHAICYNVVTNDLRPEIEDRSKFPYPELMEACWRSEAQRRPTFATVVRKLEAKMGIGDPAENDILSRRFSERRPKDSMKNMGGEMEVRSEPVMGQIQERAQAQTQVVGAPTKDVKDWNEDDVAQWMVHRNMKWAVPLVKGNNLNGQVLLTLDHGDMKELGIQSFGHRRIFVMELALLKEKGPGSASGTLSRQSSRVTGEHLDTMLSPTLESSSSPSSPQLTRPSLSSESSSTFETTHRRKKSDEGDWSNAGTVRQRPQTAGNSQWMGTSALAKSADDLPGMRSESVDSFSNTPPRPSLALNISSPFRPRRAKSTGGMNRSGPTLASVSTSNLASPASGRRSRGRSLTSLWNKLMGKKKKTPGSDPDFESICGLVMLAKGSGMDLYDRGQYRECYKYWRDQTQDVIDLTAAIVAASSGAHRGVPIVNLGEGNPLSVDDIMTIHNNLLPDPTPDDENAFFATLIGNKMSSALRKAGEKSLGYKERANLLRDAFDFVLVVDSVKSKSSENNSRAISLSELDPTESAR